MEQDQFFGGPFALRELNPHIGLILCAAAEAKKLSESQGVTEALYGGERLRSKSRGSGPTALFARGTRGLRRPSFDARTLGKR
jgi:hypothetical protein